LFVASLLFEAEMMACESGWLPFIRAERKGGGDGEPKRWLEATRKYNHLFSFYAKMEAAVAVLLGREEGLRDELETSLQDRQVERVKCTSSGISHCSANNTCIFTYQLLKKSNLEHFCGQSLLLTLM
jgi:hypothetical protein